MEDKLSQLITEGESFTFSTNSETNASGTFGKIGVEMQSWVADVEDYILSKYGKESSPWRVFSRFNIDVIDGNYSDDFEEQKTRNCKLNF